MDQSKEGNWADKIVEQFTLGVASKSSRRSLLGRMAIPVFMLMGFGGSTVAPFTRRALAQAGGGPVTIDGCTYPAGTTASDKSLCAMTGSPCSSCTDPSLTFQDGCPTIAANGDYDYTGNKILRCGSWVGCCPYGTGGALRPVIYVDCCSFNFEASSTTCSISCINQANCKEGTTPARNGTLYCSQSQCGADPTDGSSYYLCTYVSQPTGACI
jgi:hypothetical protein